MTLKNQVPIFVYKDFQYQELPIRWNLMWHDQSDVTLTWDGCCCVGCCRVFNLSLRGRRSAPWPRGQALYGPRIPVTRSMKIAPLTGGCFAPEGSRVSTVGTQSGDPASLRWACHLSERESFVWNHWRFWGMFHCCRNQLIWTYIALRPDPTPRAAFCVGVGGGVLVTAWRSMCGNFHQSERTLQEDPGIMLA